MATTFQVGDMTIHRIVETEIPAIEAFDFFPNLTPELFAANRDWLRGQGGLSADARIVLCFQSYLIRTPHHTILVDGCNGNHKERNGRPLWHRRDSPDYMSNFENTGISLEDVDYVLCTHLHADHVGWNTKLENGRWVPTFPNARYVFAAAEFDYWTKQNEMETLDYMVDSVLPVIAAGQAELVHETHQLGDHLRLMPTPGHTLHHFAVALGQERDQAVLTGDLIHSPLQMRHPELTMRRDDDPAQAVSTRRAFLERYAETDTLCCTAHFPSPSVVRIGREGAVFRCLPVSA